MYSCVLVSVSHGKDVFTVYKIKNLVCSAIAYLFINKSFLLVKRPNYAKNYTCLHFVYINKKELSLIIFLFVMFNLLFN